MPWQPLHSEVQPQQLGTSLDAVLRRFGGPSAKAVGDIFADWPTVVGTRVADHCQPLRIDGSTLVVGVADSAWASEIRWMSKDLLAKIGTHTGSDSLDDIRVTVSSN